MTTHCSSNRSTAHAGSGPIIPGVWRVGGGSWNGYALPLSSEIDANVYLITTSGANVLVDCGTLQGVDTIETNLSELDHDPSQLTDLLLTHSHWDHTEAAAAWQARVPSLRTHLNAVGAAFLDRGDHRLVGYQFQQPPYDFEPFRVDHGVEDGETFELGAARVAAFHLPGHTPDSTLYTIELNDLSIAICGDVTFAPRPDRGPVLGQLCTLWLSNLDHYVESLYRLAALHIDLLLPGHGSAVRGPESVAEAVAATLALAESLAADTQARENFGV